MNYQETELLMAVILIIVMEGVFLACGGFETIKEAIQAAGGTIWNMISWPWRRHKQKKQIEQEWQQFMEGRKGELAAQLMIMAQTEIFANRREWQQAGRDTVEETKEQEGEKQWRDHIMDRFMRVT